jgi:anti-sigma B factor antagonist
VVAEIDASSSARFREQLAAVDAGADLVIDFSEVTFCDSSGISALIDHWRVVAMAGGDLRVANLQPHVERVFAITGVLDLFVDQRGESGPLG